MQQPSADFTSTRRPKLLHTPPQFTLIRFHHSFYGLDGMTVTVKDEDAIQHVVKVDGSSLVTLRACAGTDNPANLAKFAVDELNCGHIARSRLLQWYPVVSIAPYDQHVPGALTGWAVAPE